MPQRITPQLTGLPRVNVSARQVAAFASPRGGRAPQNEVVDLSGIAASVGKALRQEARRKGQAEQARGEAFALENPELIAQVEAEAKKVSGEGGLDELRTMFQLLIDSGKAPHMASPFAQIGLVEQRARQKAAQVRSDLIAQLPELTNVEGEEDPPDIDVVMAEAFAEAAGSPLVRNFYGQEAFNGSRAQAEEEIRRRFDEGRLAGLTAQHRSLFRDSLGGALANVANVDDEDVSGALMRVMEIARDEGRDRNIRDVRGVLVEALEAEAANLAVEDVDRAIWLARRARDLQVNGRALGEEGSVSSGAITGLIHRLNLQRDEKARTALALDDQKTRSAMLDAQGLIFGELFAAQQDPNRTVTGAVQGALNAVTSSEGVRTILGLSAEEPLPRDFQGLVLQKIQDVKMRLLEDSAQDDPEVLEALELDRRLGVSTVDLINRAGLALGDTMTADTYDRFVASLTTQEDFQNFKRDNPYQTLIAPLNRRFILDGLSTTAKIELEDGLRDTLIAVNDYVFGEVEKAGNAPAARRAAAEQAVRDAEPKRLIREWQETIVTREQGYSGAVNEIHQLASDYKIEDARDRIRKAVADNTINPDQAKRFYADVQSADEEMDSLLASGRELNIGRARLTTSLEAIVKGKPGFEDPANVDAFVNEKMDEFSGLFAELARGMDLSGATRASSLVKASREARDLILDPLIPAGAAAPETIEQFGRPALASRERLTEARGTYGAAARTDKAEFFAGMRIPEVNAELYQRVDEIGDNPFFSSPETLRAEILSEWDFRVLSLDPDRRDDAYASLHGQHQIPYEAVLGGTITTEYKNVSRAQLKMIDERAAVGTLFGARGQDFLSKADVASAIAILAERGIEATPGKASQLDPSFRRLNMRVSFTIGSDVALSPWGTQYFPDIKTYEELDEAAKRLFLTRVGLSVEGDDFEANAEAFRIDQDAVIKDWRRRKGIL